MTSEIFILVAAESTWKAHSLELESGTYVDIATLLRGRSTYVSTDLLWCWCNTDDYQLDQLGRLILWILAGEIPEGNVRLTLEGGCGISAPSALQRAL